MKFSLSVLLIALAATIGGVKAGVDTRPAEVKAADAAKTAADTELTTAQDSVEAGVKAETAAKAQLKDANVENDRVTAAVAAILKNPASTPKQKDAARQQAAAALQNAKKERLAVDAATKAKEAAERTAAAAATKAANAAAEATRVQNAAVPAGTVGGGPRVKPKKPATATGGTPPPAPAPAPAPPAPPHVPAPAMSNYQTCWYYPQAHHKGHGSSGVTGSAARVNMKVLNAFIDTLKTAHPAAYDHACWLRYWSPFKLNAVLLEHQRTEHAPTMLKAIQTTYASEHAAFTTDHEKQALEKQRNEIETALAHFNKNKDQARAEALLSVLEKHTTVNKTHSDREDQLKVAITRGLLPNVCENPVFQAKLFSLVPR